jgi:type I restriction enzyme, S subunit
VNGDTSLGHLMARSKTSVDPSQHPDELFDLYSIPAYDGGMPEITAGEHIGSSKQRVYPGDVLLSRIVPHIRRAWIVGKNRGRRMLASGEWIVFRTDDAHASYLRHFLLCDHFHVQFMRTVSGVGGSLLRARPAYVADIKIPLPSPNEQRRVAMVLDRAESLRAKPRAAHTQIDELAQAIFIDMFGHPSENPSSWPVLPFSAVGDNEDSKRVPLKADHRSSRRGEYAYYGASGIIDWIDDYIYRGDRLLIGEDGANLVARSTPIAFLAGGKFWVNNHAHVVAANGVAELRYLEALFGFLDLSSFVSGTAQPKLTRSNLDRIPIPVPPKSLQTQFVQRIQAVEALRKKYMQADGDFGQLFASLQHRAFRGEL